MLVRVSPTLQGLNNVFLPQSPPPAREGGDYNTTVALGLSLAAEETCVPPSLGQPFILAPEPIGIPSPSQIAQSMKTERMSQPKARPGGPFPSSTDLAAAESVGGLAGHPSTPGGLLKP